MNGVDLETTEEDFGTKGEDLEPNEEDLEMNGVDLETNEEDLETKGEDLERNGEEVNGAEAAAGHMDLHKEVNMERKLVLELTGAGLMAVAETLVKVLVPKEEVDMMHQFRGKSGRAKFLPPAG